MLFFNYIQALRDDSLREDFSAMNQ